MKKQPPKHNVSTRKYPTVEERNRLRNKLEYNWHVNNKRVLFNGSTYDMPSEDCNLRQTDDGWKVTYHYEGHNCTFNASEALDCLVKRNTQRRIYRKYKQGEEVQ